MPISCADRWRLAALTLAAATVVAGAAAATPPRTALLETVGVAPHGDYDRVVFRFSNVLPGYRVSYVRRPFREDGSGKPVVVAGTAFVFVRMEPASGYDLAKDRLVYRGRRRIEGAVRGTRLVREVVRTGDFEAVLGWVIGLREKGRLRVLRLQDPPRLVIDVLR